MASLTVKNIPEPLMQRLRETAERHNRSLNRQVIELLDRATRPAGRDVKAILARAADVRARFKGPPLTSDEIVAMIRADRDRR